jgi:hypothetical protein
LVLALGRGARDKLPIGIKRQNPGGSGSTHTLDGNRAMVRPEARRTSTKSSATNRSTTTGAHDDLWGDAGIHAFDFVHPRNGTFDGDSIVDYAAGDTIRLASVEVVADWAMWERSQVDRVEGGFRVAIGHGGVIPVNSSLSLAAHTDGDRSASACLGQGKAPRKATRSVAHRRPARLRSFHEDSFRLTMLPKRAG